MAFSELKTFVASWRKNWLGWLCWLGWLGWLLLSYLSCGGLDRSHSLNKKSHLSRFSPASSSWRGCIGLRGGCWQLRKMSGWRRKMSRWRRGTHH